MTERKEHSSVEALSVEDTLKLALEALQTAEYGDYDKEELNAAITAIKAVLSAHKALMSVPDGAQPAVAEQHKQEPVAKVVLTERLGLPCLQWLDMNKQFDFKGGELLYTTPYVATPLPPQYFLMAEHWKVEYDKLKAKQWVGLTEEDRLDAKIKGCSLDDYIQIVEAKLKQKNGYAEEKNT